MATSSTFDRLTPEQKITAAGIDIMQHEKFALLAGCVVMGKLTFEEGVPTAGTDGRDEFFGAEFMALQNRKQTRWIRLHENFHKALHHCTDYATIVEQHKQLGNMAQDFVINGFIYETDPKYEFCEPPVGVDGKPFPICFDTKYLGWSFIEVLRDLLKQPPSGGGSGKGKGKGEVQPGTGDMQAFDEHRPGSKSMTPEEKGKLKKDIEDALRQGKIVCEKLAGRGKGGNPLDSLTQERNTNWRDPLREFITTICKGWDYSRFCPPNKRLLPWCIMPSHFSESCGEIIVACDMSGSMMGVVPVVLGEVAQIAKDVMPEGIRVIWWDDGVNGEQYFAQDKFDTLKESLRPLGCGGTRVSCVAQYIAEKDYKPKCVVVLSDGYIESSYELPSVPVLWGIVDNPRFVPIAGKVVHIDSGCL